MNTFQRHEENLALPPAEKAALECVKAGLETWEYKAKNALMYYPEGKNSKSVYIVIKIKEILTFCFEIRKNVMCLSIFPLQGLKMMMLSLRSQER